LNLFLKLYIGKDGEEPFLGRGPVELLENILKTGSIRAAASGMRMSYSKAHRIIRRLEKGLGLRVLRPETGGAGGGGSVLTEEGRRLIRDYRKLEKEVTEFASGRFSETVAFYGKSRSQRNSPQNPRGF